MKNTYKAKIILGIVITGFAALGILWIMMNSSERMQSAATATASTPEQPDNERQAHETAEAAPTPEPQNEAGSAEQATEKQPSDQAEEATQDKPARSSPSDATASSGMTPHKAIYNIDLVSSSGGSQVVNISGRMYFEWQPTCDAWTTDHRFNLVYEYADAPAMQITSDFSTYEPFDGESFSFSSLRSRDGEMYEELRGKATMPDSGTGQADYRIPEDLSFDLPPGTIFPMHHTQMMAARFDEGTGFFNKTVFDGSDQEGPVEINTFIGQTADVPEDLTGAEKINAALLESPARYVQMAFFTIKNENDNPASDYEMQAVLHKNSVISDMVIDYKEFTIRQNLVALEKLEPDLSGCAGEQTPDNE